MAYVNALYWHGRILGDWLITSQKDGWRVYGTVPAQDALRHLDDAAIIRRRKADLKSAGVATPRARVIGDVPEGQKDCRCGEPSAYYLFTTFLDNGPPLRCIDCNGVTPLYRLPRTINNDYIHSWKSNYQACDTLQIGCAVGVRFAERQMAELGSPLTTRGLAVCDHIRNETGRTVYYYLFRANGRSRAGEVRRKCPKCGGTWLLSKPLHSKFDFRCDKCALLSNIGWNVR